MVQVTENALQVHALAKKMWYKFVAIACSCSEKNIYETVHFSCNLFDNGPVIQFNMLHVTYCTR